MVFAALDRLSADARRGPLSRVGEGWGEGPPPPDRPHPHPVPLPHGRGNPRHPRQKSASLRWALLLLAIVFLATFGALTQAADDEKGILASLISRALSTPATRVSIGTIDGGLSSDATIRDIQISDRDGVWLRLDRARIVWRRLALIQRRLEIDRLEIGSLDIARKPIPAENAVAGEDQPLLPELPVRVEIKEFALGELRIGEPILGTAARIGMNGAVKLGNPSEGLDLRFDARRLDAGGQFTVRLGLVPQGQRLTLALNLDEPEGGILARSIAVPGLPPVKLDLKGDGTLDKLAATLTFDAGQGVGASGRADVNREGAGRRLALDLEARIAGLLPEVAAPVFAGTTSLTGTATYGDDGAVAIPGISLSAAAARLDVSGSVDAAGIADIRVTAANVDNGAARTTVSGAEIRRLAFDGRVAGPIASPQIDANLSAEDARLPAGRLAGLAATIRASRAGETSGGASRIRITADARATGIVATDPALAKAIGGEVTLALKGTSTAEGGLEAEALSLATPTATALYAGRLGSAELRGRLQASVPDLSRFADLAGLALRGEARLAADLDGTPRANRYNAVLDAHATRFATGLPALDGLSGGRLDAAGTARLTATGGIGFEEMRLTAANADARLDGLAAEDASNLTVALTIPDLKRADARLTGRAALTGQLTGSVQNPDATARIAVTDATALGRPVPRLVIDAVGRDLVRAPDLRLALDGEIDRKPARGGFHAARGADGRLTLDGLDLMIGSVALQGGAALDAAGLASGRLTVKAGDLDDLSPLVLTKATGSLDADVTLASENGGQDGRIVASGARISAFGISIDRIAADLSAADLYRRPVVTGSAAIGEAVAGGERISRVRLDAKGNGLSSDVTLTAAARGFDLDARGRIVPGERTRFELAQLGATRGKQRIGLAGPATLTLVDGGVDIRSFALAAGTGRLTVDGTAARELDLRLVAHAVPLSAAEIVAPGLGLAGTFEGEARLAGAAGAPNGEYRAGIAKLVAPQTRDLGLPPADITASGRLAGGRATIDASVAAGRAGTIRIGGSVPLGAGALDLAVRGAIDAGAATTGLLAAGGRRLTGRVEVDARVAGTLAAPQASGSANLADGTFTDALQGTQLSAIRARIVARGQEVAIEAAQATARNGGTIRASGRVRLDPDGGFPGQIRVSGERAELVRSGLATAVANLAIDVSGPLARDPRVSGRVEIVSLDVAVPERLSATLGPLPNTRHLNPTRTARARLALDAKARGKGGRAAPAFDAALDLRLTAPGHIFVRGRGLNAELGGDLRLTGTLAKPVANGAFELRSGRLQIVSSRLDFSRGRLTFAGDLTPELDFLAKTSAAGATIEIAVTGPASDPAFEFRSSPDLPRDEILSRLLFNSASGQLSTGQAIALAQAAAQFSGSGGGGVFEDLRKSLGLNGLDVSLGASGGPGLGLGGALNDRVSVGVKAGGSSAQTGIGVDVRITDQIRLQGEVGSNGATSVGIGAEYEW